MENKQLEILVVEDNPKHMEDAQREISSRIEQGANIKVDYVSNYNEAVEAMKAKNYDGIITDIFMPSGIEDKEKDNEERVKLSELVDKYVDVFSEAHVKAEMRDIMAEWMPQYSEAPFGAMIAYDARLQDIPVVMCTAGYHHGKKYEPIFHFSGDKKIFGNDMVENMVDGNQSCTEDVEEVDAKQWNRAYCLVIQKITRNMLNSKEFPKGSRGRFDYNYLVNISEEEKANMLQWHALAENYACKPEK